MFHPITSKQIDFIVRLVRELDDETLEKNLTPYTYDRLNELQAGKTISIGEASSIIEGLLKIKRSPSPSTTVLEEGVYQSGGQIYKVKKGQHGLYALRLTEIGGKRLTEEPEVVHFEYVYAPGVVKMLKPTEKLDFETAKKLTIRYGNCLWCERRLKDAESVERGIGPVCRKRFG